MDSIVETGIRRSRAEIVVDGLKAIKFSLDHDADEVRDRLALAKQVVNRNRDEPDLSVDM